MVSSIFCPFTTVFSHLLDSCSLQSRQSLKQDSFIIICHFENTNYLKSHFYYIIQKKTRIQKRSIFPNTGILTIIRRLLTSIYRSCHSSGSLVASFSIQWPRFEPRSGHLGFEVGKVALWYAISKYFGFLHHLFHWQLHAHHHPSSGVRKHQHL
jgi:hypothetical protein